MGGNGGSVDIVSILLHPGNQANDSKLQKAKKEREDKELGEFTGRPKIIERAPKEGEENTGDRNLALYHKSTQQ